MNIKTSLDWDLIKTNLVHKSIGLKYSNQLNLMIRNISIEVTELSRAEVLARRGKKYPAEELLVKINNDIAIIEEFLLVATLLG